MRDAQATIVFLNKEKILKESGQDEFLLQHILQSFIEFDSICNVTSPLYSYHDCSVNN